MCNFIIKMGFSWTKMHHIDWKLTKCTKSPKNRPKLPKIAQNRTWWIFLVSVTIVDTKIVDLYNKIPWIELLTLTTTMGTHSAMGFWWGFYIVFCSFQTEKLAFLLIFEKKLSWFVIFARNSSNNPHFTS